jgi:hypothetical protein
MLPLVVSPITKNVKVTKMLVDGGASLNILSAKLVDKLQITEDQLALTKSFLGVNPGATQPWGKIELPVTFGTRDNYRTENIMFDITDIALTYNGIIGRPALAKFMVVTHHAYNALKLPSSWGTLMVKTDIRDAVLYAEQMFKAAATAFPWLRLTRTKLSPRFLARPGRGCDPARNLIPGTYEKSGCGDVPCKLWSSQNKPYRP